MVKPWGGGQQTEKKEEDEEPGSWPQFDEPSLPQEEKEPEDKEPSSWPLFENEEYGAAVKDFSEPTKSGMGAHDVKPEGETEAFPMIQEKDDQKKLEPEDNALGYEPTSPAFEEERKVELPIAKSFDEIEPTESAFGETDPPVLRSRHLQPAADTTDLHLTDVGWETTAAPLRREPPQILDPLRAPLPRVPVKRREEKIVPCPLLLVGSKLDKECPVRPGRWVEVGRNSKAHVLIPNPAVSKHHCKLLWKKGSAVELRVLDGIVHVNDRRLQPGSAVSLKHGDMLKIYGKGICFRIALDMRTVDPTLPNVRTLPSFAQKEVVHAPRSEEDELRRKIKKFRALANAAKEKALLSETRLTELQTKRKLRAKLVEETIEKSKFYEKDERRLEEVLINCRDQWLERLQTQSERQAEGARPLAQITSDTQAKLDALQHLKEGQEMLLHPERHMKATVEAPPSPASDNDVKLKSGSDSEEEAFPALKGAEDGKTLLPIAPAGTDDDVADLFGDFNSDEDDEAPLSASTKRPAPDGDEAELSPKKQRADDDDEVPLAASMKRPVLDVEEAELSPKKGTEES